MSDDIPETLPEIEAAIGPARDAYFARRADVADRIGTVFENAAEATDRFIIQAEEWSPDEAIIDLLETPHTYGPVRDDAPALDEELGRAFLNDIENAFQAHERLDQLNIAREKLLKAAQPDRHQRFYIDGREYAFDAKQSRVYAPDRPEEHCYLPSSANLLGGRQSHPAEGEPSLTESIAQETGAPKAEPQPADRTRQRHR